MYFVYTLYAVTPQPPSWLLMIMITLHLDCTQQFLLPSLTTHTLLLPFLGGCSWIESFIICHLLFSLILGLTQFFFFFHSVLYSFCWVGFDPSRFQLNAQLSANIALNITWYAIFFHFYYWLVHATFMKSCSAVKFCCNFTWEIFCRH